MTTIMKFLTASVVAIGLLFAPIKAQSQVSIGVGVGPVIEEPYCPYGYYDYAPYYCAPYGYYGPDYFADGLFIGVGPWYRYHARGGRYYHVRPTRIGHRPEVRGDFHGNRGVIRGGREDHSVNRGSGGRHR